MYMYEYTWYMWHVYSAVCVLLQLHIVEDVVRVQVFIYMYI